MELMNPQKESESKTWKLYHFYSIPGFRLQRIFLGPTLDQGRIRSSSSKKMCRNLNELDYCFLKLQKPSVDSPVSSSLVRKE